jgi:G:T/U-mismatch repair DNA glycosylase
MRKSEDDIALCNYLVRPSTGLSGSVRSGSAGRGLDRRTRLLILGSLPGEASNRRAEPYAQPRNPIWRLLATVVGLWDVVRLPAAQRSGRKSRKTACRADRMAVKKQSEASSECFQMKYIWSYTLKEQTFASQQSANVQVSRLGSPQNEVEES